jgi:hypothetical protein
MNSGRQLMPIVTVTQTASPAMTETERQKLAMFCFACSKLNVMCQPAFDFEAFTRHVARHEAFADWIATCAALESNDTINSFIREHNIDIGFNGPTERARRKTRLQHYRAFARQLVALRRIGIVHCETLDNRGIGLFLLNTHAALQRERDLLANLCAIGTQYSSMWTTSHPEIVAELHRLDLRSVIARTYSGSTAALLVGPLSWLNHSLRSGVVLTVGGDLLRLKIPNKGMLFAAVGFDDRREFLIRYDSPGSAGWADAVQRHPWLDDV